MRHAAAAQLAATWPARRLCTAIVRFSRTAGWLVVSGALMTSCASAGGSAVLDPSEAYQTGYRDGYANGVSDARRRIWPNPQRTTAFRSAHHGYDRRCGCAPEYAQEYRTGFLAGYERAYDATDRTGRPHGGNALVDE